MSRSKICKRVAKRRRVARVRLRAAEPFLAGVEQRARSEHASKRARPRISAVNINATRESAE
jgi:hypothetical protein